MDRREMLQAIAALTGCAFVGAERVEALAYTHADGPDTFLENSVALLDEIAETILPRTDTPGAKDAKVGAFIARYATACYDHAQLNTLRSGVADLDARSRLELHTDFMRARREQKETLLTRIDAEAKRHALSPEEHPGKPPHWFTLFKQLTLMGFFTSEAGATRVARYRPVPGPYKGVVAYKGETFWAW